jgi:hypothetical protein
MADEAVVYPATVEDFKSHFDRDFPFAPTDKEDDKNYIRDKDILKAFAEAAVNFNPALFDDNEIKLAFLYISAHYLCVDTKNSTLGLASSAEGFMASKNVGSVGVGYQFPQWLLETPLYSILGSTGYGLKFLGMIVNRARGNFGIAKGGTQP